MQQYNNPFHTRQRKNRAAKIAAQYKYHNIFDNEMSILTFSNFLP